MRPEATGNERDLGAAGSAADDLDYMHARMYLPQLGRFLAFDPIGGNPRNPQSWNRYACVLNRPMTHVDPYGLSAASRQGFLALQRGIRPSEVLRIEARLLIRQESGQGTVGSQRRAPRALHEPEVIKVNHL